MPEATSASPSPEVVCGPSPWVACAVKKLGRSVGHRSACPTLNSPHRLRTAPAPCIPSVTTGPSATETSLYRPCGMRASESIHRPRNIEWGGGGGGGQYFYRGGRRARGLSKAPWRRSVSEDQPGDSPGSGCSVRVNQSADCQCICAPRYAVTNAARADAARAVQRLRSIVRALSETQSNRRRLRVVSSKTYSLAPQRPQPDNAPTDDFEVIVGHE